MISVILRKLWPCTFFSTVKEDMDSVVMNIRVIRVLESNSSQIFFLLLDYSGHEFMLDRQH